MRVLRRHPSSQPRSKVRSDRRSSSELTTRPRNSRVKKLTTISGAVGQTREFLLITDCRKLGTIPQEEWSQLRRSGHSFQHLAISTDYEA